MVSGNSFHSRLSLLSLSYPYLLTLFLQCVVTSLSFVSNDNSLRNQVLCLGMHVYNRLL